MTINNISSNNTAIKIQPLASKPNTEIIKKIKNINQNASQNINQSSALSPLSSRYTYAIGRDGKKYILQLSADLLKTGAHEPVFCS